MIFTDILREFREIAYSKRDLGDRFERLMVAYLKTDPKYSSLLTEVWLWHEFPFRYDFGVLTDTGIDIVAKTEDNEYWAVQCKFYGKDKTISKSDLDTFLATSSKTFFDDEDNQRSFSNRLLITTTDKWGTTAELTIRNQNPPVQRISLYDLLESPVDWQKLRDGIFGVESRIEKYTVKPHQKEAIEKTIDYFVNNSRGKLIMACGTGKTFVSLRIAERQTDNNGFILFLVPSIALLGQILNEWTAQAILDIRPILICSDPKVNKNRQKSNEDDLFTSIVDLALPATTDTTIIRRRIISARESHKQGMTVVFSTYQSIDVLTNVQKQLLIRDSEKYKFDLVICDEAHRTTGVTLAEDDESYFVKIHQNTNIISDKRLYMTATPRIYSDDSKSKAAQAEAILCSMDDERIYGEEIHRIGFGEAVEKDLLTDYKVLILTISDQDVSPSVQRMITDDRYEINADDAAKLIGSINALSKQVLGDEGIIKLVDPDPMKKAVAFTNTIKNSKRITLNLNETSVNYINDLPIEQGREIVKANSRHIDGSMSALARHELMNWLKDDSSVDVNECKILTNVRCLSEGVDVPSLDAVLFLSARNSQVDVVQSVGRVMRKAPNKRYGYIIIPVVAPIDVEAETALDNNDRYKVVWTVLNALRAHDDRFNATVNKIDLNKKKPDNILIGRTSYSFDEEGTSFIVAEEAGKYNSNIQMKMQFDEIQQAMYAKLVKKVGDRRYWEQWANSVADIAKRQMERIKNLVNSNKKHDAEFKMFLNSIRNNLNPSITKNQAIEMLSQHIITKPVFEALFEEYSFVHNNPISISMQNMLNLLEEEGIEKDSDTLSQFYDSVRKRAERIDNAEGKQRIIIELYDKFFKTAFPKMVEQLGIVYTPVEVVDFIIYSIDEVLKKEFNRSITDENVHILDPFTGTGTFITRLLQSGLIKKEDLLRKYVNELHANEIVLLAYYIAAINIENAFHDIISDQKYYPFEGICLTDTFQLNEVSSNERLDVNMFPKNSNRVEKLKKTPLTVIYGNPPYSTGQKSANDNAQNQSYPILDARIANTYAKESTSNLKQALYDTYIKSFRWATDRLKDLKQGVIAFVTNGAWIDGNSTDGFRKTLVKEFEKIYVYNLRGNARTSGVQRKREAGNVFGSGSRTPIAITILIKNNMHKGVCEIYYNDIGDYLNRKEKLEIINSYKSIYHIKWRKIKPNHEGDWINKRSEHFNNYIPINPSIKFREDEKSFFIAQTNGLATSRDYWLYNSSKESLKNNVSRMVNFYNRTVDEYAKQSIKNTIKDFVDYDSKKINWSDSFLRDAEKGEKYSFDENNIGVALYRPFFKQYLYYQKNLIHRTYQMPVIFPDFHTENRVIICTGKGASKDFSVLMTNLIPNNHTLDTDQCFPLYFYENSLRDVNLFNFDTGESNRKDSISNYIMIRVKDAYHVSIGKDDLFYYVYGLLHIPNYRETYKNDLAKGLPRIPIVDDITDFWKISNIGKKLGNLHMNYESVKINTEVAIYGDNKNNFIVKKMKFKDKENRDIIIYNKDITVANIPLKAYEYRVNNKSAIEWIMDRYMVTTDKASGIKNDPNDWAKENNNPRYILDLLLRIIEMSIQSVDLINSLPNIDFNDD